MQGPVAWWAVAIMSVVLIVLGMIVLVRDARKGPVAKRGAAKLKKTKKKGATAADVPPPPLPSLVPRSKKTQRVGAPRDGPDPDDDGPMTGPILPRVPELEAEWPRLKSEIDTAIADVNLQVAQLRLTIGAPGAPSWSLQNYGYGDYRRVLLDNSSLAWLRLELAADRTVSAKLSAHDPEISMINGHSVATAQRSPGLLTRTLLEALTVTTQYANWRLSNVVPPSEPRTKTVTVAAPLPATAIPQSSTALADAAIDLVNSAFREAGARLMPLRSNQWPGTAGRDARVLAIDAKGALAGTLLVDPQLDRIEIAVTSGRSATVNAAQRQTLPLAGLSVQTLAETVATSAWPAIAAALPAAQ